MIDKIKLYTSGYMVKYVDGSGYSRNEELTDSTDEAVKEWLLTNTPEPEFTQVELDRIAQENINQEALTYLASTDWYVIRFQETGVVIPQTILDARAEARLKVVTL